ncbi:MAG: polysaccharide deacetylase family protein [Clostridium sp.]|nr:polysaccharide deacetylase family protein [Clostridium sp.]
MRKAMRIIVIFLMVDIILVNYTEQAWASKISEKKIVYLTFDDGPSFNNTDSILNVLCRNNIKATFCVVGENVILNKGTTNRMKELGMGIIPHCNCHEYNTLYLSLESYMNDLQKCEENINKTIGEKRTYKMVRIPGGSSNRVCSYNILQQIKDEIKNDNMYYIDWNLDCGDTYASTVNRATIEKNILDNAGKRQIEVVLMHDLENKTTTTEALQNIINKYKELGYEFKIMEDMDDWEIDYLIHTNVINRK